MHCVEVVLSLHSCTALYTGSLFETAFSFRIISLVSYVALRLFLMNQNGGGILSGSLAAPIVASERSVEANEINDTKKKMASEKV